MKKENIVFRFRRISARYLARLKGRTQVLIRHYPYQVFIAMVGVMLLSAGYCLWHLRAPGPSGTFKLPSIDPIRSAGPGPTELLGKLGVIMQLQAELKTIAGKDSLNSTDSLHLESLLAQLEKLQIKKQVYEKDQSPQP